MKRNKKGFTLVELVIVIAVIAILAGVMVAVFSGVIKRANESAELQQVKNDELKQKADDVLTKLDNANWFSWEDFENSLAEKLTSEYKRYASENQPITSDAVEKAVKSALDEFAKNNVSENTSLTEAQVKYIVENAISKASLGGVTEAQVRTIVNTAVADINTVSKSDIQKIVDAATAKGLTADAVAQKIAEAKLASATSVAELSTKIDTVVAALNALTPVTNKDIEDKIIDLLPVTYTANTADEFKTAVGRLNSFSTIYVNFTPAEALEVKTDAVKTLIIKGSVTINQLEVDAPKATIYLATDAGLVDVKATAQNSFHVASKVTTLNVNSGRVVVEDGAKVETLKAAPSVTTTVKVAIEEEGTVTNLIAEYQKNGNETNDWIEVENNGTVGTAQLKIVADNGDNTVVTTNVKVVNGANAKGTEVEGSNAINADEVKAANVTIYVADESNKAGTLYDVTDENGTAVFEESANNYYWGNEQAYSSTFAGGDGTFEHPYEISNALELARLAYLVNGGDNFEGKYIVLTADIDLGGRAWMPISAFARSESASVTSKYFAGIFDGQNHTITNLSDNDVEIYSSQTMANSTTPQDPIKDNKEFTYGLFATVCGATIKNVNLANVQIDVAVIDAGGNSQYLGDHVAALVGYAVGAVQISNVDIKSGSIKGFDDVAGVIGGLRAVPDGKQATITNCSNSATVVSEHRAAGIVGNINNGTGGNIVITSCTNNGDITSTTTTDSKITGMAAGIALCAVKETKIDIAFIDCSNNELAKITTSNTNDFNGEITVIYTTSYNYNSTGNILTENGGSSIALSKHVQVENSNGHLTCSSSSTNKLCANWESAE